MRELRTQENEKFERFFQIVRNEAQKQNCLFFVDCGEGREFFEADMEGEDLSGWLIPAEDAERFQPEFDSNEVSEKWDGFMKFLRWKRDNGKIQVQFEDF